MVDFQDSLQNPTDQEIIKEIEASNEKDYYRQLKKKNKNYLIDNLTETEKKRIAQYIVDRYKQALPKHNELCDKIDEYDEVFRMVRKSVPGDDGDMPNYRTPLSTVTLEVVHANEMNVFFTPKDIMRVIPTEENDVPKVKKLGVFGNWSIKNEMEIFENIDRLFHNSGKNGECPYIVHWVKEYGTDIEREMVRNPANPAEPLIDPDTQEPIFQEVEKQKLLYNGPKLEIISRKDYIQPESALMDIVPEWEIIKQRMTYDTFLREMYQGKLYSDSLEKIVDWSGNAESSKEDYDGDDIPVAKFEKEFLKVFIRMRINTIKEDKENETIKIEELEDEFIATIEPDDVVLCELRKNKFPLKQRPVGVDYFIPDDEGRRMAIGIMEFMDGPQKAYDALFNQYIFGVSQSNSPFGFFSPMANQRDEAIKVRNGYMYPSSDPGGVNFVKIPPPDATIHVVMEMVSHWSQMLFGISDYAAGMESKIDPSAPAKKAEIVVSQGNVRLNMIIKRKNKTLCDIFKRWYLLYKENMPKNKFMRIAGSGDNPWKFESVSLEDFALNSIPDFELTGNILNVNKQLEANKALAIYNVLVANPFFSPQSPQGIQALHSLTKWVLDKLDDTGLSRFLPEAPGEMVQTPEEENARFLQGDYGEPTSGEDHGKHIKVHQEMLIDPTIPDDIKEKIVAPHIQKTIQLMQQDIQKAMVMQEMQPMGGMNGQPQRPAQGTPTEIPAGMEGLKSGV